MPEFDSVGGSRLSEILAPNDPRAASNSTPNVTPTETSFSTFSRRSGVSPESALNTLQEGSTRTSGDELTKARHSKNPFSKYILGGNAYGKFTLPGGIPFINPVKTLFSGLDWTQKNVADPLAGFGIGGIIAPIGGAITSFDKFDRIAENYRDSMRGSGGLLDTFQNAGEYNRERESLFIGEKFISSLVFDPTSYLGFGFLGKVPLVGRTAIQGGFKLTDAGRTGSVISKLPVPLGGSLNVDQIRRVELSLGALEEAYVGAFNFPFNKLGKLYTGGITIGGRQLPILGKKNSTQEARRAGNITGQQVSERIVQLTNKNIDSITTEDVQQALGPLWSLDRNMNQQQRELLEIILKSAKLSDEDILLLTTLAAAENKDIAVGTSGLMSLLVKDGDSITPRAIALPTQGSMHQSSDITNSLGFANESDILPQLKPELRGATPNFGLKTPKFLSDVDKALYIIRNQNTQSKRHAEYREFLEETLGPDANIEQLANDVHARVKELAGGVLDGNQFDVSPVVGATNRGINDTLRLRPTEVVLSTPTPKITIDLQNRPIGGHVDPVSALTDDLDADFFVNPLTDRPVIEGIETVLVEGFEGAVIIKSLKAMEPGQGKGKALLNKLVGEADKKGIKLELDAVPIPGARIPKSVVEGVSVRLTPAVKRELETAAEAITAQGDAGDLLTFAKELSEGGTFSQQGLRGLIAEVANTIEKLDPELGGLVLGSKRQTAALLRSLRVFQSKLPRPSSATEDLLVPQDRLIDFYRKAGFVFDDINDPTHGVRLPAGRVNPVATPAVQGTRLFRGGDNPGRGGGMVSRGEISAEDLQLGSGRYMTPSESDASTFGNVTEQILLPEAQILDLDSAMTGHLIDSLNDVTDNIMDSFPDAVLFESPGEWYYSIQSQLGEQLDDVQAAHRLLNESLLERGFHAIKSSDPMDEINVLDELFLVSPPAIAASTAIDVTNKGVVIRNLGEEVGEAFIDDAVKVADLSSNASIKETMETLTSKFLTGGISADELADYTIRLMGGTYTHAGHLRMVQQLERLAARAQASAKSATSRLNGRELINWAATRDRRQTLAAIDTATRDSRKGLMGALVQKFDDTQVKVIQNGVQKHITNPMARAVLMFPAFPIQEMFESQGRTLFGNGKLGFMSDEVFNRKISYFEGIPSTLQSFELTVASRAAQLAPDVGESTLSQSILSHIPGEKLRNKIADKLSTNLGGRLDRQYSLVNLGDYLRVTNEISAGVRRQYLSSRIFHHQTALFSHDYKQIAKQVDGLSLDALRGSEHKAITEDALMAFSTGNEAALFDMLDDYTAERILAADLDEILNKGMSVNDMTKASQATLRQLVDTGNLTKEALPGVKRSVMLREWEDYKDSAEGAVHALDALNSAFSPEEIARMDKAGLGMFMYRATESLHYLTRHFEGVMREATERIADEGLDAAGKIAEWEDVQKRVNDMVVASQPHMQRMRSNFASAEERLLGEVTNFSDDLFNEYATMAGTWTKDRARVNKHFADARKSGDKQIFNKQSFWDRLREIRKENFADMELMRRDSRASMSVTEMRVKSLLEDVPGGGVAPAPSPIDLSKKTRLTVEDIAAVMGVQPQNITQGLFKAAFQSKEEFISAVQLMSDNMGHNLGRNSSERIGDVMDDVLRTIGVTDRQITGFGQKTIALDGMFDELASTAGVSRFGGAQKGELERYVGELVDTMRMMDPEDLASLKSKGKDQVAKAVDDMKRNFVNYDDTTAIDDFMQAFFPFWTYESRRLPYLLRQGFNTPVMWSMFMPEGKYDDATDNGYVDVPKVPWMQLNFFGGTMFNAPRRVFKAEFPPQHDRGMQGYFSKFEEDIGRFGFYFGNHIKLATEVVGPALGVGEKGDAGELVPPPVNIGLAAAEVGLGSVPGVGDAIKFMRRQMLPDKFRQWQTAKVLADGGYNPGDINWETWTIQSETSEITQGILEGASRKAALMEFTQESLGNVRFRGDSEKQLRQTRDDILIRFTGFTQTDLDRLRRDGVDPLTQVSLPQVISRYLSELPGASNFRAANALLRAGSKGEFEAINSEFWRIQGVERDRLAEIQLQDDLRWLAGPAASGGLAPNTWRDRLTNRKREKVVFFDSQRGRRRKEDVGIDGDNMEILPDGHLAPFYDVPVTREERAEAQLRFGNELLRIQHPLDAYIEQYHAIVPRDRDGDGQVEFGRYFTERQDYLENQVPIEMKQMLITEVERNATEVERALLLMQRGALGEYWLVDDNVTEMLGIQEFMRDLKIMQLTQPRIAKVLRLDARYVQHQKEVTRRRDLMRTVDPLLDYTFNVFGFTGDSLNWKNPIAETWWRDAGNRPSLEHFPLR